MLNFEVINMRSPRLSRLKWPLLYTIPETQAVVPIDGPTKPIAVNGQLAPADIAVFDNKAANAVLLDAESQLKSGYPTIATSSMVARRNRLGIHEDVDNHTDIKFFSELVKPVQYRWKFQKDKLKTMQPSKHGFHPRSQSPTFQRLIDATEKLHLLSSRENPDDTLSSAKTDFFETQSEIHPSAFSRASSRVPRSEPATRTSSLPAAADKYPNGRFDFQPDIRTIEPTFRKDDLFIEEDEDDDDSFILSPSPRDPTPPPPIPIPRKPQRKVQREFKVDFKKLDSHSELHLFLPHIEEGSRGATPDTPTKKFSAKCELPRIDDSMERKSPEDDHSKNKKKQSRKKRKLFTRVKSGLHDDKEFRDRLNDVPTLISLENERDFHPASMCVFENCMHHQHRKSTKIRQA
ncbi:hypothetical protein MAR_019077 [Mya arenaria]|uniref:Uncharacterized protein n=1 Tax=Mya arenaria TaxID=6604 RepID=A0ABY7EJ04_MYAAR|nr:uncharacterized protein LOC128237102 isoform X2 [Mya arenaria]WAR09119.1 hypothetical protein MAR_019077 [Mya arenaria]